MVEAGMNVARLNFSHGDHATHKHAIENIRKVSAKTGVPIAILQDLQGPKIRVEKVMQPPLAVSKGQQVVIGKDLTLDGKITKALKPKQRILIEDGLIELVVKKVLGKFVYCTAQSKGIIQARKGVNLPSTVLKIPSLTPADIKDVMFGLAMDVDFVALSFVRTGGDIRFLRKLIAEHNPKKFELPKIVAKIEKPEAVENFDDILEEADAIMVARGDLGVEISESDVPIIQKTIIQKCLRAAKPVIVATHMLDSMIRNPRPTRAEVSDVANAVIDHADCVMLSGESAFGSYPVESVKQMSRIIYATERSPFVPHHRNFLERAVALGKGAAHSLSEVVGDLEAKVMVGITLSGELARELSRERPPFTRIIMLTPHAKLQRQLCLFWGTASYVVPKSFSPKLIQNFVKKHKAVHKGEHLVIARSDLP